MDKRLERTLVVGCGLALGTGASALMIHSPIALLVILAAGAVWYIGWGP